MNREEQIKQAALEYIKNPNKEGAASYRDVIIKCFKDGAQWADAHRSEHGEIKHKKWEYIKMDCSDKDFNLTQLGLDGWDLCDRHINIMIFKREIL